MMTKEQLIQALDLKPLPLEGGYFRETYRAEMLVNVNKDNSLEPAQRSLGTAIFYLVTPEEYSKLHRVKHDELFHFYLGDAVEMLQLDEAGKTKVITLGPNILTGEQIQTLAPAHVWQGTRLKAGGAWALLGTTMSPGFDYSDFELGNYKELSSQFPQHSDKLKLYCGN